MKKNKQKVEEPKVVYYEDILTDDFAGTNIKTKKTAKNFKFVRRNPIWRFFSWFVYYFIAVPIVGFYCFLIRGVKIKNKKALRLAKKGRKQGVFFYSNHSYKLDCFTINMVSQPYRNQILASEDTFSIPGIKNFVQMLGAVPVPSGIENMRNFNKAIEYYLNHGRNIAVYPEQHIWPYYTGVRPFKDVSFTYPIKWNAPLIVVFTAYSKPTGLFKKLRKTNMTIILSDPIYPDPSKPLKEAKKELRDKVFNFMNECSKKYSTYDYIVYKHISEKDNIDSKDTPKDNTDVNNA